MESMILQGSPTVLTGEAWNGMLLHKTFPQSGKGKKDKARLTWALAFRSAAASISSPRLSLSGNVGPFEEGRAEDNERVHERVDLHSSLSTRYRNSWVLGQPSTPHSYISKFAPSAAPRGAHSQRGPRGLSRAAHSPADPGPLVCPRKHQLSCSCLFHHSPRFNSISWTSYPEEN